MSLMHCPECGHEISNTAVACPNCGRPVNVTPVVERKVVVARHRRPSGVPTWAIATVGILGVLLLFMLFVLWSRSDNPTDEANTRLRVNMNGQHTSNNRDTVATTSEPPTVTSVPSSVDSGSVSVPSTTTPPSVTSVGGSQVTLPAQPTKGTAVIQAKVVTRNNSQQPVRGQRFYLLDKDVETILSDANVDPIEGNTLTGSLGLAAAMPDRYGDFQRRAMQAIKNHVKYAGTTDSNGKASLGNIDPNSYYLFGVVRSGNGFALWSSPISIVPGENVLDLTPQQITEIDTGTGEE